MNQIHFTINGVPCVCGEGTSILQAAKLNGIEIPNLCNDESVRVYGACGPTTAEAERSRSCSAPAPQKQWRAMSSASIPNA